MHFSVDTQIYSSFPSHHIVIPPQEVLRDHLQDQLQWSVWHDQLPQELLRPSQQHLRHTAGEHHAVCG